MREWLVIEDSRKNSIFMGPEALRAPGYIPRDAAEALLGRDLDGMVWFTKAEGNAMRSHPCWRDEIPPLGTETGIHWTRTGGKTHRVTIVRE